MTDPGVPPPIAESEPQAGTPRTIHPIGSVPLRVGTPLAYQEDTITMDRPETYHIVEKNEVLSSRDGKSRRQFAAGTRVPLNVAYDYGLVEDPALVTARPADEQPAVAESDEPVQFRSEGAAPENRMEPAPQNRGDDEKTAKGGKK